MIAAAGMPQSFVGYGLDLSRNGLGLYVKVCAWCPDKSEMDQWAAQKALKTSHTACPKCYQKQIAELTGDKTS
jgi:hypothetical protein